MVGFIYILSNPAIPNRIKIGKSTKDPNKHRAPELYTTGVPEPFKVEYIACVEDEDYLERAVFNKFLNQRPIKGREFFEVDCITAINAIRVLSEPNSKIKYEEVYYVSEQELEQHRRDEQRRVEYESIIKEQKERLAHEEAEKVKLEQQKFITEQNRQKKIDYKKEQIGKIMFIAFGWGIAFLCLLSLL